MSSWLSLIQSWLLDISIGLLLLTISTLTAPIRILVWENPSLPSSYRMAELSTTAVLPEIAPVGLRTLTAEALHPWRGCPWVSRVTAESWIKSWLLRAPPLLRATVETLDKVPKSWISIPAVVNGCEPWVRLSNWMCNKPPSAVTGAALSPR